MANKSHRPFTHKTPELEDFISRLSKYDYNGPITLELHRGTSLDEIAKTKTLFDDLLGRD
jgi:hypothetical protein